MFFNKKTFLYSTCQNVNEIVHKCEGNTTERVFLAAAIRLWSLRYVSFRAASWIGRLNNIKLKHAVWNWSDGCRREEWMVNTATSLCFGRQEKLGRERLNLEKELAVEAYPTFVADERGSRFVWGWALQISVNTQLFDEIAGIPALSKREMLVFRTWDAFASFSWRP